MPERVLQPYECWREADGDPVKYRELMIKHGHLVKNEAEPKPPGGQLILGRNPQRRREQGRQRDDG